MSRVWPTAETACRVTASLGRSPVMPTAGSPAAIAPDVTSTHEVARPPQAGGLRQSLVTAASSIAPVSSVIDDVPTFTPRSRSALTRPPRR